MYIRSPDHPTQNKALSHDNQIAGCLCDKIKRQQAKKEKEKRDIQNSVH